MRSYLYMGVHKNRIIGMSGFSSVILKISYEKVCSINVLYQKYILISIGIKLGWDDSLNLV